MVKQLEPSKVIKNDKPFTFEATDYDLSTDQLGTQLDPPAHWNPDYPAIDELPATFAELRYQQNATAINRQLLTQRCKILG